MIAILKPEATLEEINRLYEVLKSEGLDAQVLPGDHQSFMTITGERESAIEDALACVDIVESVKRFSEPYKKAGRKEHRQDTVITVGDSVKIGGGNFAVIAGPCSVESEEQVINIAHSVKKSGADILRGGAFKPRTSPYDFQGLHAEGIKLLLKAKKEVSLPVVSEITDISQIDLFNDIDIIQVGARNMQNFELLKELGRIRKPILLKRGMSCTLKELLMSAEYIMAGGNDSVILCERGIRTFESYTRNTLDLSAVPMLHELSHLPVLVDPSHATGVSRLVSPMALASAAAGADGVMIEVHNDPLSALSDGPQALTPDEFDKTVNLLKKVREAVI